MLAAGSEPLSSILHTRTCGDQRLPLLSASSPCRATLLTSQLLADCHIINGKRTRTYIEQVGELGSTGCCVWHQGGWHERLGACCVGRSTRTPAEAAVGLRRLTCCVLLL